MPAELVAVDYVYVEANNRRPANSQYRLPEPVSDRMKCRYFAKTVF